MPLVAIPMKMQLQGEIHGGMTPEEYLVPVIVVSRKKTLPPKEATKKPKGITINDDMLGVCHDDSEKNMH
ncbi:MAG: hypothetical protein ACOX0F_09005 [Syntrophomonadaceae bacterium]